MPDNYQHEKVCPECGRRKVYIGENLEGYYYYCTECDWRQEIPA